MTLGTAGPARPFTLFIDTVADLPEATLRQMRDDPWTPIRGIGIYLGEANSAAKRDAAFSLGMFVLPYTFSRAVGWTPDNYSGQSDGNQDAQHAADLGIPSPVHLITDLEGCSGTAPSTTLYLNARGAAQRSAGFGPGLYVGAGQPLGGLQLGALIQNRYVQALSRLEVPGEQPGTVIEVPEGWNARQLPRTTTFCGTSVDFAVMQYGWDVGGRMIEVWWPDAAALNTAGA